MGLSFPYILFCLFLSIAIIVLLTARYRVHAFFALMLASLVMGLAVLLPLPEVLTAIKDGFGNIMKSLGLLIVLGTTLGVVLEHTGSTRVMAAYILRKVGQQQAPLAMSVTGFIVGMPIFCDSGYIVLSGLNQSLAKRTGISIAMMATSLATGLYAVHCLIPPHPGAAAAAGILAVDFGKLILLGILTAIPASMAGYLWAKYMGKETPSAGSEYPMEEQETSAPSALHAFLPVVVPILLIALHSFLPAKTAHTNMLLNILASSGDPAIALSIGILLAFTGKRSWNKHSVGHLLQEGAEKAGGILVIIGAGGAFGAVLAATKIGEHFSTALPLESIGLFFPFLLTFILKTAQGSSTVAIITASSIVLPLLPALGLDTADGKLICVLSMGAGSMMISHANDAYFWVIAKFSGLEMKTMLKVYSMATVCMGIVSLLMVYLLSQFLK